MTSLFRHLMLGLVCLALASGVQAAAGDEPLAQEQAYRFSVRAVDAKTLEARWQIADGYYMYRDKFAFSVEAGKLGTPQLPPGKIKDDESFGRVETYRKEVKILLPIEAAGSVRLTARSQGCWDGGVCYPPMDQEAAIALPASTASAAAAADTPTAPAEDEALAAQLAGDNIVLVLASFFGFGLLLAMTPCVFPMIPILSGIIVSHGHAVTRKRAAALSAAYVLGMALTYTAVGVAAGLSGTLLSAALQNAWVLTAFALVFVALSASMFGLYDLQLPASVQSRLSDRANSQGGSFAAIALMGSLSALIVGPCVAAPLAGALLYIAKTGNAVLGGAALFVMALGMGAPLLLVGTFSRSLLPRSGPWMEGVKKFFGVLMLATALWLVSPVAPLWAIMLGWALLLILPAIHLHALEPLPTQAATPQRLAKGLAVVLLLGGTAMLMGVLGGATDPLQPLGFLRAAHAGAPPPAANFQRVASAAELDARLSGAGQAVMLDFYADWCVSCKEMEHQTFSDPRVGARMKDLLLLKADVTANSPADKELLKRFGLFGPPGIIFFAASGQERNELRVVGYQPPERFMTTLEHALHLAAR